MCLKSSFMLETWEMQEINYYFKFFYVFKENPQGFS